MCSLGEGPGVCSLWEEGRSVLAEGGACSLREGGWGVQLRGDDLERPRCVLTVCV